MKRPKLLLADDSVTIRKVVELTFADEGIDVTTAADAGSAMEKFVEDQPDILLIDVSLPGTSGYQICDMIKQDEATKHIPVLLLVGAFEPFDQEEALRSGADGFLTKPFHSIRELVSHVKELLAFVEPIAGGPLEETEDDVHDREDEISELAETKEDNSGEQGGGLEPGAQSPETLAVPYPEAFDADLVQEDEYPNDAEDVDELQRVTEAAETKVENDDIENLYNKSFVERPESEDVTVDPFADFGLDDQMIEASYQGDGESAGLQLSDVTTQEFDWSPASLVTEPETHDDQVIEAEAAEPSKEHGVTSIADEPELSEGSADTVETEEPQLEYAPEIESYNGGIVEDESPLGTGEVIDLDASQPEEEAPKDVVQIEPLTEHHEEEHAEFGPVEQSLDERDDSSVEEQVSNVQPSTPEHEEPPSVPMSHFEPSEETISRIADLVIERLSDQVIREIAEAKVPEVAERLVKEAFTRYSKG